MSWHAAEPAAEQKCCSAGSVALPASCLGSREPRIKGSREAVGSGRGCSRLERVGAADGSWGAVTDC